MTQTSRLRRATHGACGGHAQSLLRSFLHDERNQGATSHRMPNGNELDAYRVGQVRSASFVDPVTWENCTILVDTANPETILSTNPGQTSFASCSGLGHQAGWGLILAGCPMAKRPVRK